VDLYRSKAAIVGGLTPLVDVLARRGVAPDAVTLAAIPLTLTGGICLLLSPQVPSLLLAIPVIVAGRLVLNLLDGALARSTGRIHPRGEFYNEVADRVGDVVLLVPVAFLPGADGRIVLLGVVGGLLASFVGVTVRAAGGERVYRGVLSKPGRMILLAVFAVAAVVAGPGAWGWFGPILLVGTSLTFVERLMIGIRRLA
jgi:CDP-diacylglycerol--glycerol-3-phosphate 3-phosphatidyltransferase